MDPIVSRAKGEVAEASSLISDQGENYRTGRLKSDDTSMLRLSADLTQAISARQPWIRHSSYRPTWPQAIPDESLKKHRIADQISTYFCADVKIIAHSENSKKRAQIPGEVRVAK